MPDKTRRVERFNAEDTISDEEKQPGNRNNLVKTKSMNVIVDGISGDEFWIPLIKNEATERLSDEFYASGIYC